MCGGRVLMCESARKKTGLVKRFFFFKYSSFVGFINIFPTAWDAAMPCEGYRIYTMYQC
jgi:hypothetical protein